MFEGGPILVPPLAQDPEIRRPVATKGGALDTFGACPPLDGAIRVRPKSARHQAAVGGVGPCCGKPRT